MDGNGDGQGERSLLLLWSPRGYRVRELDGGPPEIGSEFDEDGRRLRVVKIGPSPYPGDRRRCAFALEA